MAGERECDHCGSLLRLLFQFYYCPNDCERLTPEQRAAAVAARPPRCPKCRSTEVEPFVYMFSASGMMRCRPCGAVWTSTGA